MLSAVGSQRTYVFSIANVEDGFGRLWVIFIPTLAVLQAIQKITVFLLTYAVGSTECFFYGGKKMCLLTNAPSKSDYTWVTLKFPLKCAVWCTGSFRFAGAISKLASKLSCIKLRLRSLPSRL